jgi:hypothetical protein
MAAHDKTGSRPAYVKSDPPPGGKVHNINLDSSGISMSLKTLVIVLGFAGAAYAALIAYSASLSTVEDLAEHNVSAKAHPVMIDADGRDGPMDPEEKSIVEAVADNANTIQEVRKTATRAEVAAINVENGFYDQRAETFAQRAVDKLPKSMPTSRKIRRYEEVKSKARKNLEAKKPVHSGMEELAF